MASCSGSIACQVTELRSSALLVSAAQPSITFAVMLISNRIAMPCRDLREKSLNQKTYAPGTRRCFDTLL